MLQLEELRRQNDLKIAELDQRSQESRRAIAEATKESSQALLRVTAQAHTSGWKYTIAFLILAAISCLQVLTLAYPDGLPWAVRLAGSGVVATASPSVPSTSTGQPSPAP